MTDFGFPLVEVCGNAYELGYQHGAQAAGLIDRYLALIDRLTGLPREVLAGRAGLSAGFAGLQPGLCRRSPRPGRRRRDEL